MVSSTTSKEKVMAILTDEEKVTTKFYLQKAEEILSKVVNMIALLKHNGDELIEIQTCLVHVNYYNNKARDIIDKKVAELQLEDKEQIFVKTFDILHTLKSLYENNINLL